METKYYSPKFTFKTKFSVFSQLTGHLTTYFFISNLRLSLQRVLRLWQKQIWVQLRRRFRLTSSLTTDRRTSVTTLRLSDRNLDVRSLEPGSLKQIASHYRWSGATETTVCPDRVLLVHDVT